MCRQKLMMIAPYSYCMCFTDNLCEFAYQYISILVARKFNESHAHPPPSPHTHTHTHTQPQILEILEKSPVWSAYKDQKHDLFLSNTTVSGYLTGPSGVAGYLTAGSSSSANNANSSAPPPLEPPEDTPTGDDDDDD